MESKQKPATHTTRDDDVDLGHLFSQTGGAINNFFNWLGRVFAALGHALLLFVFFLKRNILWLALGAVLGMAYGLYVHNKTGASYYADMTVKTNFNSTRNLYGTMSYFNALISNHQSADLARIFSLTPAEASSINWFEAQPVVSEVITADMYKERFLNLYHNTQIRMDTFWIKTITYKEFKNSLTKYDYPLHQIRVTSNNAHIFPKIQQGLMNYISANEMLRQVKANGDEINRQEIGLLESSLQGLDTLRNSYNKRLASGVTASDKGNSLTMLEGDVVMTPPELELYNKVLQLKDELKMVKNQAILEKNILEVYAPFPSVGQKEGILRQKIGQYALYGLLLAFVVTALIALYKSLSQLESKYKQRKPLRAGI